MTKANGNVKANFPESRGAPQEAHIHLLSPQGIAGPRAENSTQQKAGGDSCNPAGLQRQRLELEAAKEEEM